jgi:hypothetical protein
LRSLWYTNDLASPQPGPCESRGSIGRSILRSIRPKRATPSAELASVCRPGAG